MRKTANDLKEPRIVSGTDDAKARDAGKTAGAGFRQTPLTVLVGRFVGFLYSMADYGLQEFRLWSYAVD